MMHIATWQISEETNLLPRGAFGSWWWEWYNAGHMGFYGIRIWK